MLILEKAEAPDGGTKYPADDAALPRRFEIRKGRMGNRAAFSIRPRPCL
jgi:hypothetical protein